METIVQTNQRCGHRLIVIGACAVAFVAREARAHFLFIHIGPQAEAGRSAEVYFSEQAQAGDPTFIDKIAHTQLWVQKTQIGRAHV